MSVRFGEEPGTGTEEAILGKVDVEVEFKPTGNGKSSAGSIIGTHGVRIDVPDVIDRQEKFQSTGNGTEGTIVGKYGVRIGVDGVIGKQENVGSVVTGTDNGVSDDDKSGKVGVVIIGVINGCRQGNTGVITFANAGDGVHEEEVGVVIGKNGFVVSKTEFVLTEEGSMSGVAEKECCCRKKVSR